MAKKKTPALERVRMISPIAGTDPNTHGRFTYKPGTEVEVESGPFSAEDCERLVAAGFACAIDSEGNDIEAADLGIEVRKPGFPGRETADVEPKRETANGEPNNDPPPSPPTDPTGDSSTDSVPPTTSESEPKSKKKAAPKVTKKKAAAKKKVAKKKTTKKKAAAKK